VGAQIQNMQTGHVFKVDPQYMRVKRLQKRVHTWADRLQPMIDRCGIDYRLVMIRLSYVGVDDWRKLHVSEFMQKVRKGLGENLQAYAWVAELQKRGAVHYHVLLLVKKGTNIPVPDKCGWWEHGSTRIETARSPYYIVTYTGKKYQKFGKFPKGMRMFAVWIKPGVITSAAMWMFRLSSLPKWLCEDIWKDGAFLKMPKRVKGGGWSIGESMYHSPWEYQWADD
jgi:hypothetical protein